MEMQEILRIVDELFWLVKDSGLPPEKGQEIFNKIGELEDELGELEKVSKDSD